MLAALSTLTFDPAGHVLIDVLPSSALQARPRRVERVATLDGGSVFNEFGFAESDMVIELTWQPTDRTIDESIDRLTRLYSRVHLSMDGAAYNVAIDSFAPGTAESSLTLLVIASTTS